MNMSARLDRRYLWHPFTQMREWVRREPIVIVEGRGAVLRDARGREYLDANSSIWTNLHGHAHPLINAAIRSQLKRIAHSSALGLANEPASVLAAQLLKAANPGICDVRSAMDAAGGAKSPKSRQSPIVNRKLSRVFFSDDGSTALEAALKMAYEFARRSGRSRNPKFLSLTGAYHGDTIGAVSLGHIDLFHKRFSRLLFRSDEVMAPYCYRCPFNRARPEREDAREYRKCSWECVGKLERKLASRKKRGEPYSAFVVEPLMQGAAGMIPQPSGWLSQAAALARSYGALLIADEVMTGFGRTGDSTFQISNLQSPILFACHQEGVQPDLLCVAKGMTGGYLPMAATLASREIFDAFLGEYEEFKTFFHGHSYTANQLGAAASLASLKLLQSENVAPRPTPAPGNVAPRTAPPLGASTRGRHPAGRVGRRNRTRSGLADPKAVRVAGARRHARVRSDGPSRRADASGWQCGRADAAVLHDARATAPDRGCAAQVDRRAVVEAAEKRRRAAPGYRPANSHSRPRGLTARMHLPRSLRLAGRKRAGR